MVGLPTNWVVWDKTFRVIRSIHPPIDLFEDIADPADWEAIASAEAKTNPRANITYGDLSKVPLERRVSGEGASWVMAPFVHCSPFRPSRFSDGSFGIYYAADSEEAAIHETAFHHAQFMKRTEEEPGWTSQFRTLVGRIDAELDDVRSEHEALDPDSYAVSQALGADLRRSGSDGIHYPSARLSGGLCIAVFWPDVVTIPVQAGHWSYHYDGERVDVIKRMDDGAVFAIE